MPFLYRKSFEVAPQNNITEFKATNGVNQIQFLIPAVPAMLNTQDLMFAGNLQVNLDNSTPYAKTDMNTLTNNPSIGLDSVLGVHSLISRVDLISMRSNTLIEQRLNYQLIQKYQRGVQSASNLENGRFNNQQMCSSNVLNTRNFLGRTNLADDGQSFACQLNTGLMKNNQQSLNLQAMGGLLVRIYLAEPIDAFFNIDPAQTGGQKIGNDFNFTLKNIKLFGRYNYVTNDMLNQLSGVAYKKTDNLLSVVQSSNDTLSNSPQVMALHKMIYVYQPNKETSNNKDVDNFATNSIIGLNDYLLSLNGVRRPLDYQVDVNPTLQELPTTSGTSSRVVGNAEQSYLSIGALNDQFPPTHSLVNPQNQAKGLNNYYVNKNLDTKNVDVIGMNYSFNFEGYTIAVPNDLMSINVKSGVKTSGANLPDGTTPAGSRDIVNDSATQNLFVEYDAMLNYSNMQTGR